MRNRKSETDVPTSTTTPAIVFWASRTQAYSGMRTGVVTSLMLGAQGRRAKRAGLRATLIQLGLHLANVWLQEWLNGTPWLAKDKEIRDCCAFLYRDLSPPLHPASKCNIKVGRAMVRTNRTNRTAGLYQDEELMLGAWMQSELMDGVYLRFNF